MNVVAPLCLVKFFTPTILGPTVLSKFITKSSVDDFSSVLIGAGTIGCCDATVKMCSTSFRLLECLIKYFTPSRLVVKLYMPILIKLAKKLAVHRLVFSGM